MRRRPAAGLLLLPWLLLGASGPAVAAASHDDTFREGRALLAREAYSEAAGRFASIPADTFEPGDYPVFLRGLCLAKAGDTAGAEEALLSLREGHPGSLVIPYLEHELAWLAAGAGDLDRAARHLEGSRARVEGGERRAREKHLEGLLMERAGQESAAADLYLEAFSSQPAGEAGRRSMDRLLDMRARGNLSAWGKPLSFHAELAGALEKAAGGDLARAVRALALGRFPREDAWWRLLLEQAGSYRRDRPATARRLLTAFGEPPESLRAERDFLLARAAWREDDRSAALELFLKVSDGGGKLADEARMNAVKVLEEQGDAAGARAQLELLRTAGNAAVRVEALSRIGFLLAAEKRHLEAAAVFKAAASAATPLEASRLSFWRARSLVESGKGEEADGVLDAIAGDPNAGPWALLAIAEKGGDAFAVMEPSGAAPDQGGRSDLWERLLAVDQPGRGPARLHRARRLAELDALEYAVLEASAADPAPLEQAVGLPAPGAEMVLRYLAGDLGGAIRVSWRVRGGNSRRLLEEVRYPLAPAWFEGVEGVDPLLAHAVIRQESAFRADEVSRAGAVGLMQLLPTTAADEARRLKRPFAPAELLDPAANVRLGSAHLARLADYFDGDWFRAVAAYNAGAEPVKRWWKAAGGDRARFVEAVSYAETRRYLGQVFSDFLHYRRIYR